MKALLFAALLALVTPAFAHGPQKGPNGGPMEDVAGVHVELVSSGTTITLHVFDEGGKPIATQGFTATAMVVVGSQREMLKFDPQGQNQLKGEAKAAVPAGANITVTLKTNVGKSGQGKFKL